jgi:Fe-S-cluster containining protein
MMGFPCRETVKSGKCNADCCGIFAFGGYWWDKHKDKAVGLLDIVLVHTAPRLYIAKTYDRHCCFLNRDDFSCIVYNDRPYICRAFGRSEDPMLQCPYLHPNGTLRSEDEIRAKKEEIDASVGDMKPDAVE